ncbi:hypothetical protein NE237_003845 [Protea cynaroides]|uniref:Uncharacterized protein n=1 Tax=Protea cynaroides TaxID=273540 RepID=A0A9Q0KI72_9MAGN|nr:hypothetical protein NE237_003845 [Protea cynaroides]
MDLAEAIALRGGWFALGWDLEEENEDEETVQEDEFQHSSPSAKEVDDSSLLRMRVQVLENLGAPCLVVEPASDEGLGVEVGFDFKLRMKCMMLWTSQLELE